MSKHPEDLIDIDQAIDVSRQVGLDLVKALYEIGWVSKDRQELRDTASKKTMKFLLTPLFASTNEIDQYPISFTERVLAITKSCQMVCALIGSTDKIVGAVDKEKRQEWLRSWDQVETTLVDDAISLASLGFALRQQALTFGADGFELPRAPKAKRKLG